MLIKKRALSTWQDVADGRRKKKRDGHPRCRSFEKVTKQSIQQAFAD
ncbi:hypothetical protein [Tateyamaria sp. Alg231-49]|nr:hypothetical protein [Tateyamaria sp. Alg231-49]